MKKPTGKKMTIVFAALFALSLLFSLSSFAQTTYSVSLSEYPKGAGYVQGGGSNWTAGVKVTVYASPYGNNRFVCWTENGSFVSANPSYTFDLTQDRTLVAQFSNGYGSSYGNNNSYGYGNQYLYDSNGNYNPYGYYDANGNYIPYNNNGSYDAYGYYDGYGNYIPYNNNGNNTPYGYYDSNGNYIPYNNAYNSNPYDYSNILGPYGYGTYNYNNPYGYNNAYGTAYNNPYAQPTPTPAPTPTPTPYPAQVVPAQTLPAPIPSAGLQQQGEVIVMGRVLGDDVIVRGEASSKGSSLGTLQNGDDVTVLGYQNGFMIVKWDNAAGYAYVSADNLNVTFATPLEMNITGRVYAQSRMNTASKYRIETLNKGDTARFTGRYKQWWVIETSEGTGYVKNVKYIEQP